MTFPGTAAGGRLDLAAASRALSGIRDMLAADGYDMSLRAVGTAIAFLPARYWPVKL